MGYRQQTGFDGGRDNCVAAGAHAEIVDMLEGRGGPKESGLMRCQAPLAVPVQLVRHHRLQLNTEYFSQFPIRAVALN